MRSIADRDRLAAYPFYAAALGELELRCGSHNAAREHFRAAAALARNRTERSFLHRRIDACTRGEVDRAIGRSVNRIRRANRHARCPIATINAPGALGWRLVLQSGDF